ncbi:RNA polymerase sigma factor [Streptomyces sp. cg35]|uniref:RNA polymerase sigma factor n=1 Tax=Streptomyces sp. cg35 TaxID=3421650 RepID=UPI003D16F314
MNELNDGYGDALTTDEVIGEYESWLHARAHQMLSPADPRHDDLVQEGRIAMWQALDRHDPVKGALPSWLTQHATWHMRDVLTHRDRWTGRPARSGNSGVDQKVTHVESLDAHLDPGDGQPSREHVAGITPDVADEAMIAYHRGEISKALDLLSDSQKRYVHLRFFDDLKGAEMKAQFGYDPSALWNSPRNGAKHKLRAHLSHLEAA